MIKQPDKPRLWCIFNADSGHWMMVNYEKQHEAVNASTAYAHGLEVHEMLCRSDVEQLIREAREAAVQKERERSEAENRELVEALEGVLCLARLVWGNLDNDANKVFEAAELAINKQKGGAE